MATLGKTKPPQSKHERFVEEQISRARARIRTLDLTAAMFGFCLAAGAYFLGIAFLDKHFELPSLVRQIGFGIFFLGSAVYLTMAVLVPLGRRVNPYFAARQVEETLPEAKNSLVNWLDLSQKPLPPAIRVAITQRAARDVASADLDSAISGRRPLLLGLAVGVFSLLLFGAFVRWGPSQFFSLFNRTFLPFSPTSLASRTQIELLQPREGNAIVTVGKAVDFALAVHGKVPSPSAPDKLRLLYRYAATDPFEEQALDRGEEGTWVTQLAGLQVRNGFFYKLAGGDTETAEYRVQVRSTPLLTDFDVKYHYRPYLNWPDETAHDPNLKGLRGTEVTLVARSNRSVRDGVMEITGVKNTLPGTVSPDDSQTLRFSLVLEKDASYRVWFTAEDGEKNTEPMAYTIQVLRDRPPEVVLRKPGKEVKLPVNGLLQPEGLAHDDFGLTRLALHMKVNEDVFPPRMYREGKSFRLADGSYPQQLDYLEVVDLAKIKSQDGSPLKKGMTIEYWLEATDNCDYPRANVATSEHWRVLLDDPVQDQKKKEDARSEAEKSRQRHDEKQDQLLKEQAREKQEAKDQNKQEEPKEGKNQKDEAKEKEEGEKERDLQKKAQDLEKSIADQEKKNQENPKDSETSDDKNSADAEGKKGTGSSDKGHEGKDGEKSKEKNNSEGSSAKNQQKANSASDPEKSKGEEKSDGKQTEDSAKGGKDGERTKTQPNKEENNQGNNSDSSEGKKNQESSTERKQNNPKNKSEKDDKQEGASEGINSKNQPSAKEPGDKKAGNQEKNGTSKEKDSKNQPSGKEPGDKKVGNQEKNGTSKEKNSKNQPSGKEPGDKKAGDQEKSPKEASEDKQNDPKKDAEKPRDTRSSPKKNKDASGDKEKSSPGEKKQPQSDGKNQKGNQDGQTDQPDKSGSAGEKPDAAKVGQEKENGKPLDEKLPEKDDGGKAKGTTDKSPNTAGTKSEESKKEENSKNGNKTEKSDKAGGNSESNGEASDKNKERAGKAGEPRNEATEKETKDFVEKLKKDLASKDENIRERAQKTLQDIARDSRRSARDRQLAEEGLKDQRKGPSRQSKESGSANAQNEKEEASKESSQAQKPGQSGKPGEQKKEGAGAKEETAFGDKGGSKTPNGGNKQSGDKEKRADADKDKTEKNKNSGQPGKSSTAKSPDGDKEPAARNGGDGNGDSNQKASGENEESKQSPANSAFQRKAGELQLETFKKKVTKDVLKDLKWTEDDYRKFLKAYEEMVKRKDAAPTSPEKLVDPRGEKSVLPNQGPRRVRTGLENKNSKLSQGSKTKVPPGFEESFKIFSKELSEMQRSKD